MDFSEESSSPALAFDKDAFELTVEDVYDISYVIGRDLLKISGSGGGEEVSDLQFRIVRVLEMFEALVNRSNLCLEELRMERDNLKAELQRVLSEGAAGGEGTTVGPNQLLVDLTDPNRPRFTMQELKEVLQERNQLKAQLLVAQEELQLYKRVRVREVQSQRETSLSQRETSLSQRETSLSQRETSLSQRETSPSQRETSQSQRETSLSQRETSLSQRETSLSQRETSLSQRETSLSQRETSLSQRETSPVKRDKSSQRETSLSQRETV
ncbi:hypothetical protein WMY93_003968 [Mugilogobius chulae]|uniref:RILP-like protein 2 n=1 Tax=Mugilogobius chulae TaxID=88201 RepID=A0AAW0PN71_9GOBI